MNHGPETKRNHQHRIESGFYNTWMQGQGLDIGYGKGYDTVLPTARGIESEDWVNGKLPVADESQDYVYSSHCLEHIDNWEYFIQECHRVLKIGGYCITIVPHICLYEKKKELPSRWNGDHKRFYHDHNLLWEFSRSLIPNTYRVRLLEDNDRGYDYSIPPSQHCNGSCEIVLVTQKIKKPDWDLD